MRDLKADLREWNSDLINGIRSTDWFYLAGEYIERAIDAEEELEKQQQLFEAQTGRNVEIIKRLNERKKEVCDDNAALREENDLQRHSIKQLSAQVAAYREAIADAIYHLEYGDTWTTEKLKNTLSQPDPGAEIMERMKKLEAVAEALRNYRKFASVYCDQQENIAWQKVEKALADLGEGNTCT